MMQYEQDDLTDETRRAGAQPARTNSLRPPAAGSGRPALKDRILSNRTKTRTLFARRADSLTPFERFLRKATLRVTKSIAEQAAWTVLASKARHAAKRRIIVKPVGNGCNNRCDYCFHRGVLARVERMSFDVVERVLKSAKDTFGYRAKFCWHGGEPMLAGMDFYRAVLQRQREIFGGPVENNMQTNATLITPEWVDFFRDNRISIGLSLDGNESEHDKHRKDAHGRGTFAKVMRGIELLRQGDVPFGVIAVVAAGRRDASGLYDLVRHVEADEVSANPVSPQPGISPTPEEYGAFVIDLIEQWAKTGGEGPPVGQADDFFPGLLGELGRDCYVSGACSRFLSVESDGSVKACCDRNVDRARNPELILGDIMREDLSDIRKGLKAKAFAALADNNPPTCAGCEWLAACKGGCSHQRLMAGGRLDAHDPYCGSYKMVLSYLQSAIDRLDSQSPAGGSAVGGPSKSRGERPT